MSIKFKRLTKSLLAVAIIMSVAILGNNRASATEHKSIEDLIASGVTTPVESEVLHSVILNYNDRTVDLTKEVYVLSIDDGGDLNLTFDVSDEVHEIMLFNITEDGARRPLCDTTARTCSFKSSFLVPNSGLEIAMTKQGGGIIRQTILGAIIKQNAMKEQYEIPLSFGPKTGITVDMDKVAPGMSFNMSLVPLPIKYQKFSDGRSVIGIGVNATDAKFWQDAARDGLEERISTADLYSKWKEEHKKQGSGKSLGFLWTVAGHATAHESNPDKMTGTIQFYVGTGYNYTGQYFILTYSVTITVGATGELVFTLEPSADKPFQASFNLGISAGLELYGGIGITNLASIGIYGAATFGADMKIFPKFNFDRLYISGELGMKAKLLGRDAFTFTFVKGTYNFIENLESDGSLSYSTELNLTNAIKSERDKLIAENYGDKPAAELKLPEGETKWDLNNLETPTKNDSLLTTENNLTFGDRSYAHQIASNVYAHSGTQVIKGHFDTLKALSVFANNSGELNYSIYDGFYGNMSAPAPVAGTNHQDFNAHLIRGSYSDQSYLVWQRLGSYTNGASLSSLAMSGEIKLARFDYENNAFVDYEDVTISSSDIYGDVGVAVFPSLGAKPYVFAYTNPASDPSGISANSNHEILAFHKEGNTWVRQSLGTYRGIISSFSAGCYNGRESAVFTLGDDTSRASYVIARPGDGDTSGVELARFNNAWGIRFVQDIEESVLIFMRDGILYSSYGNGNTSRVFGNDEHKLPEGTFSFIGDLNGTFMIAYLSSINSSQNIIGFIKSNGTENWVPITVTHVAGNSNVSYFGGTFLGPNYLPFIVYTVQNYRVIADIMYEDTTADMYAQVGKANNHASIQAADITNLNDLGITTNVATASLLIKNTGLFNIKQLSFYIKNAGEGDNKYVKIKDLEINKLRPGEYLNLNLELPEADYIEEKSFVLGVTSRGEDYDAIGIQSDYPVNASEGPVYITSSNYNFLSGRTDTYTATVKSLGPGKKSGKIVFYDRTNLTVYQSSDFKNLAPGEELSATLKADGKMLSSSFKNLGVRVLTLDEKIDKSQPSNRFRRTELLPAWYQKYLNTVAPTNFGTDEDTRLEPTTPSVPNTGLWELKSESLIIAGLAIPTSAVIFWLVRRRTR
ncbi:hypothetical protein IJ114_03080 [Candidatus Saccharibacteria bacterium]|nr:hypothetical protein [Candidatus Saccharibacteria bacterium]